MKDRYSTKFLYLALLFVVVVTMALSFFGCGSESKAVVITEQKAAVVSELEQYNKQVAQQSQNVSTIKVGDVAPEFMLTDVNGNGVSLSSLKGRKILLNMWWLRCKGCAEEMTLFQSIHVKYSQQGLIVMAISTYDNANIVRAYAQAEKLSYSMLVDEGKLIHMSYIICGVPTTFFIDEEGVVRAIKDGAFSGVEEIEAVLQQHNFIR